MSVGTTKPAGSYAGGVSPYGAHDMAGNAAEWVADRFDASYYQRSPERNPTGPSAGERRVLRGGSWFNLPFNLRSALRSSNSPGLRLQLRVPLCEGGLLAVESWILNSDS